MKKYFIILFLVFVSVGHGLAQVVFFWPRQKNATESAAERESSEINLDKAYEAYNEGNVEKTKYFLDQSERAGWTSASYYYLLGQWYFDQKRLGPAGRTWHRGYKKSGCWECKELSDKLIVHKHGPHWKLIEKSESD